MQAPAYVHIEQPQAVDVQLRQARLFVRGLDALPDLLKGFFGKSGARILHLNPPGVFGDHAPDGNVPWRLAVNPVFQRIFHDGLDDQLGHGHIQDGLVHLNGVIQIFLKTHLHAVQILPHVIHFLPKGDGSVGTACDVPHHPGQVPADRDDLLFPLLLRKHDDAGQRIVIKMRIDLGLQGQAPGLQFLGAGIQQRVHGIFQVYVHIGKFLVQLFQLCEGIAQLRLVVFIQRIQHGTADDPLQLPDRFDELAGSHIGKDQTETHHQKYNHDQKVQHISDRKKNLGFVLDDYMSPMGVGGRFVSHQLPLSFGAPGFQGLTLRLSAYQRIIVRRDMGFLRLHVRIDLAAVGIVNIDFRGIFGPLLVSDDALENRGAFFHGLNHTDLFLGAVLQCAVEGNIPGGRRAGGAACL